MSKKGSKQKRFDLRSVETARVNSSSDTDDLPESSQLDQQDVEPFFHSSAAEKSPKQIVQSAKSTVSNLKINAESHNTKQAKNNKKSHKLKSDFWLDDMLMEKGGPKSVFKKPSPKKKQQNNAKANSEATQINININVGKLPDLSSVKVKLKNVFLAGQAKINQLSGRYFTKKNLNFLLIGVILAAAIGIAFNLFKPQQSGQQKAVAKNETAKEKLPFTLYYPGGESIKTSYDKQRKVASYTDTINEVAITISQQELPHTFKYNPSAELEKVAKGMNANTKLAEDVFMGQSIKGPQTVILVKNKTLIFIKSDQQISNDAWKEYVNSFIKADA